MKTLYLIPLLFCSTVFAQANEAFDQTPIISRLDLVEANLQKIEANERTLFAQNQALSNQFNKSGIASVGSSTIEASKDTVILIVLSGLIMFLVLSSCVERQQPQHKKNMPKQQRSNNEVPKIKKEQHDEEYDFMGSQEAVPARFNLAEAYMQMREFQQAKRVLQGILEQGDSDQRQKASALLSQLPSL